MNAQLLFAFLSVTPSSSSSLKTMKSRQGHPRILLSLYNTLFLLHKLSQFSISSCLTLYVSLSLSFFPSFFLSFFLSRSLHLLDSQENSFPFRGKTSSELKHVLISYSLSSPLSLISSVTRPSQIGKFFKALGNLTRVYLMFGQILNLLWEFFVPLCILSL